MKLNNCLKQVRNAHSMTQQELAETVGVTRQTVIAVEKGRFRPSVELALLMSRALDTPLEEIFWLEGEEHPLPEQGQGNGRSE